MTTIELLNHLKESKLKFLADYGNIVSFEDACIREVYDISKYDDHCCMLGHQGEYTVEKSDLLKIISSIENSISRLNADILEMKESEIYTDKYKENQISKLEKEISFYELEIKELLSLQKIEVISFDNYSRTHQDVEKDESRDASDYYSD